MKKLQCKDLGFDCGHVIEAETEQEILEAAAKHALEEKHLPAITPEVVEAVRSAIKEVPVRR
ncbi:MAG: DUF1059 domain-containing protein [Meiothermus sp.]|nr:DUF1059 domain-containing protein [Meiothermus sp.]